MREQDEKIALLHAYANTLGCPAQQNCCMAQHTTFRTGGNAPLLLFAQNLQQISALQKKAAQLQLKLPVIGNGSNLLVPDEGIRYPLLVLTGRFAAIQQLDETTVCAQAGASLAQLCTFACQAGLTGLEFAYGIPGTVGGAIYMNAGAYGGEIGDRLIRADHTDAAGRPGSYTIAQLQMGYRTSRYAAQPFDGCITGGVFTLQKGDPRQIRAQMQEILDRRRQKQPLEYPSAGSTFRRPQGAFAGALIEQCGLKGYRLGGAMVSQKHAGFLINYDHATTGDLLALIDLVQKRVFEQTGYRLECEVKILPQEV